MDKTSALITFPDLLIWLPMLAGLLCFILRKEGQVKAISLIVSLLILAVSVASICYAGDASLNYAPWKWMDNIGASFTIGLDGTSRLLTFLTALSFPVIFGATYRHAYKNSNSFYGLMFLSQAGLMGVFLAMDALAFYFFWELALIPVYFLCSKWGGEKRIRATFKFFVYTFAGSLLMLIGIIYVYLHTPESLHSDHSFAMKAFYSARLDAEQQGWLFWLFFIAFAIKMPVFPFHTWQPDTYEQSPAPVTMVLSGIMVKMGVFALLRWLIPVFPLAVERYDEIVIILAVIGMIYASLIAIKQDDLKRLVAYSSIAHIGLICAAIFAGKAVGVQGAIIQLFSHGINIIGLWIVVELIERQTGERRISQLGGIAHKAPVLTILLVVIALANIALPLTNAFAGEFMMFSGIYQFNPWMAGVAGISIILAAVYMLRMIQKVFYGDTNPLTSNVIEISTGEKLVLSIIVVLVFVLGVYPQAMIDLTKESVTALLGK